MTKRIRVVFIIFTILFLIVWSRFFYWQVIKHSDLQAQAQKQHFIRLELPASRGEIVTSDNLKLVSNSQSYFVFLDKKASDDYSDKISTIRDILEIEESSMSGRLENYEYWVPLAHTVSLDKTNLLKDLKLRSLGFEPEEKRFYPESSMAAHIVGFVGKDEKGSDVGYFGLEGYYNEELAGIPGFILHEKDAFGNPILVGTYSKIPSIKGRNLKLYTDKTVQFIVEEKLKKALNLYGAKAGTVTIMDPKTGGILAMVSYPSYDPSKFFEFPSEYYKNPVVSELYEPGSTFKPLVMAKAIDSGVFSPTDTFDEKGSVNISGYTIRTWNDQYHGQISLSEILEYSSNVGMVYVSQKLGKSNMLDLLEKIQMGSKTGVDLQEEVIVSMRPEKEWKEIDLATASFGQGIAVTPLFMLSSISAIANDGVLMEPHFVQSILEQNGKEITIPPKEKGRVFSKATSKIITEMMVGAVRHGEAKWKVPEGYRIAGKTGTAQIPLQGHYDSNKTIASFVGFVTADNPKFVMLVTLKEPTSSPWGSETAAPLFFDIAKELISYYGILP